MAKAKKSPVKKKAAPQKKSGAVKKVAKKSPVKKAAGKSKPAAKAAAKKTTPAKTATKKTGATATASKAKTTNWQSYLTPLDDRLIVEVSNFEKRTPGGLYIPETADVSGNYKGKVLAKGRGHQDPKGKIHPMEVKAGDEVIFSEYAGTKMTLNNTEVRILRESEILGIVEK